MELRTIVWNWDSLIERLADSEPALYPLVRRSCRPLEADRHKDGKLTLALGCWLFGDLGVLNREPSRDKLARALGRMLEDRLHVVVVRWPGGMLDEASDTARAPDLLAGVSQEGREVAAACESPIQRFFYAAACRRGLQLQCQFELQRYRLDFAIVDRRIGAEVTGWDWKRAPGSAAPPERQEELGVANWRVKWFSGSEVLADVERCLDEFEQIPAGSQGLFTRSVRSQAQNRFRPALRSGSPPRRPRGRT